MRRRDFISIAGSAAAWPLAAHAQQSERMRRIGVLVGGGSDADDLDLQARIGAFQQGLQQLGWTNGQNVQIDIRVGAGDADRIRRYAEELVGLAPDVIFATGTSVVAPFLKATRTVPVVFTNVVDPVGAGFVDSLARPGGNVTGLFEREMAGAAQGNCATSDPGGRHSRSEYFCRNWPARRNPGSRVVARIGTDRSQPS